MAKQGPCDGFPMVPKAQIRAPRDVMAFFLFCSPGLSRQLSRDPSSVADFVSDLLALEDRRVQFAMLSSFPLVQGHSVNLRGNR